MFEIITFYELPSTNDLLKLRYEDFRHKSVIHAHKQTNGRGRFDRIWESTSDLTFSILFKKPYPHSLIAPIAIVETLAKYDIAASIKWPNDIIVHEKKVAGILIEKVFDGNDIVCEIVGMGINLCEVPVSLQDKATHVPLVRDVLLHELLEIYEKVLYEDLQHMFARYQVNNYLKGRNVLVNGVLWVVQGVSMEGCLEVTNGTRVRRLTSEEITLEHIY